MGLTTQLIRYLDQITSFLGMLGLCVGGTMDNTERAFIVVALTGFYVMVAGMAWLIIT
jgi:hypothetical protein